MAGLTVYLFDTESVRVTNHLYCMRVIGLGLRLAQMHV